MKTAEQIANELSPHFEANNAAIGETNRRLAKIGDGQGNPQPPTLLTPRDVFYRSSLDQNDRGVAILHPKCPIPIQQIDGYYDVEVWVANAPGSSQVYIMDQADGAGFGTDGITPQEGLINSAAFPSQDRLVILRVTPSLSGGLAVFVDVGIYQIAYEVGDGTSGFLASADVDISDPTDSTTFNPTAAALGAGEHRLVGVAFDPTTGQFFAIPGAAQSTVETLPSAESRSEFVEADYLAIDFTGYYPAGYVYTYYGQTTPEEDDCLRLFDPRLFIKKAGAGNTVRATTSASGTVANTTSETTLLGTVIGSASLAANTLDAGRTLRIQAWGTVSDTGTPTLTIKVKLGSTVILTSGAITLAGGISNKLWRLEAVITCRSTGGSGSVFGQGQFIYNNGTFTDMVNTAGTTIDTTASQVVDVTATWGAASASNTISCSNAIIEVLN